MQVECIYIIWQVARRYGLSSGLVWSSLYFIHRYDWQIHRTGIIELKCCRYGISCGIGYAEGDIAVLATQVSNSQLIPSILVASQLEIGSPDIVDSVLTNGRILYALILAELDLHISRCSKAYVEWNTRDLSNQRLTDDLGSL